MAYVGKTEKGSAASGQVFVSLYFTKLRLRQWRQGMMINQENQLQEKRHN